MALPDNHHALQMTRQQLSVAIGVPGETIAYWLKEGLLFALGEPKHGRGNHRRFGYEAVHIAAILAELSRYRMNTTGLRNLSSRLWDAVELGRLHPDFTPFDPGIFRVPGFAFAAADKRIPAPAMAPVSLKKRRRDVLCTISFSSTCLFGGDLNIFIRSVLKIILEKEV